MESLKARVHPHWVGGRAGYNYSVICNGELLVSRSVDAACDAARALKDRGIAGKLVMLDGKTGRPRYTVNIEKAAGLMVEENRRDGPRFRKARETTVYAPYSAETGASDTEAA
jgi:hypothetical protein